MMSQMKVIFRVTAWKTHMLYGNEFSASVRARNILTKPMPINS